MKANLFTRCMLVREPAPAGILARTGPVVDPHRAAGIFRALIAVDAVQEEFWALFLDTKRQPVGAQMIGRGTQGSVMVHPADVFRPALLCAATSLIVAHNHPSGDPHPSGDDNAMTDRLDKAARLLGLDLADHLVLGSETYWSSALSRDERYPTLTVLQ